jgi:hypothetical protein
MLLVHHHLRVRPERDADDPDEFVLEVHLVMIRVRDRRIGHRRRPRWSHDALALVAQMPAANPTESGNTPATLISYLTLACSAAPAS